MKRGDIYKTKKYGDLEIRVVLSANEVVVRFLDTDYFTLATKSNICSGGVKDLMKPSVKGVGYIGRGKHSCRSSPEAHRAYGKWRGMISRCYDPGTTYYELYGGKGVTVSEEWKCFQNFCNWYISYKFREDSFELDKDILCKGNKVYCKEYCSLVPSEMNKSILNCAASRGELPQGVSYNPKTMKYKGSTGSSLQGKYYRLFTKEFHTVEEAWEEYKIIKEIALISMAHEWRGRVNPKVLKALSEWEIEWND